MNEPQRNVLGSVLSSFIEFAWKESDGARQIDYPWTLLHPRASGFSGSLFVMSEAMWDDHIEEPAKLREWLPGSPCSRQ